MIIYGTDSKQLGTKKIQGEHCPNCDQPSLNIVVFANYFHLFFIPFLPYKKKAYPFCTYCETKIKKENTPQKTKGKIISLKKEFSYPYYLFSGVIIVIILAIWISIETKS